MSLSVMIRLAPEALAEGRLVGQVELVVTGERTLIASADELVCFLRARVPISQPALSTESLTLHTPERGSGYEKEHRR